MNPYVIFRNTNEMMKKRGGLCPYCLRITGWDVHAMGIVFNQCDLQTYRIDMEISNKLREMGCSLCKFEKFPVILVNTCMSCGKMFYDYVYEYAEKQSNGGVQYALTHIGLIRVWPPELPSDIPEANADLPENCQDLYKEAAGIFAVSPRSSAVLLRLCLQDLLIHLGGKGTIYEMISEATKKLNLPNHIQQFMDVVRYHGNEAAHNSDLELNPNEQTENVLYLFSVINEIANYAITLPKESNAAYDKLPANIRQAIEKRDKKGT